MVFINSNCKTILKFIKIVAFFSLCITTFNESFFIHEVYNKKNNFNKLYD